MSARHTPGPWFLFGNGHCVGGPSGDDAQAIPTAGVAMCGMSRRSRDECAANARLIAAAPDLLDVVQFFLRGIEGGHIKCAPYIDFDPNAEQLEIKSPAQRLRDVIAKATGSPTP